MPSERYEFIKGEVSFVFQEYKVKGIHVSGFKIASEMDNVSLIAYSSLSDKKLATAKTISLDGFFIEVKGCSYIYYNDINRSYERQNWTILHEIGHIVLDHTGCGEYEEDEANFFAKYAIAPPIIIHKIGAKCAMDIYEVFDLSAEAAEYAYKYYCAWKRRYERTKRLTEYEKRLLALFKESA